MAVRVVELLEMVDVQHHQAQRRRLGSASCRPSNRASSKARRLARPLSASVRASAVRSFELLLLLDDFIAGRVQLAMQGIVRFDDLRYDQSGDRLGVGARATFDLSAEHFGGRELCSPIFWFIPESQPCN